MTPLALALALTAADPQALAARVQGYYEKTRDLEARFVQTYSPPCAGYLRDS